MKITVYHNITSHYVYEVKPCTKENLNLYVGRKIKNFSGNQKIWNSFFEKMIRSTEYFYYKDAWQLKTHSLRCTPITGTIK